MIKLCRKKNNSNDNFNVPIDSFYGAEVCDFVCLYILNYFSRIFYTVSIGLYRYNRLAIIKQTSKSNVYKIKN